MNDHQPEKVRSLLASLIIDFVLLLPDIVAAVLSGSITMLADILKCINELLATFFSWAALKKISGGKSHEYEYGIGKLENLTSMIVAAVMVISLFIVLFSAVYRIKNPSSLHEGGVALGILLMVAGMGFNAWLSLKNYRIAQKEHSPIMESQWRLFRTKAMADAVVFSSLVLSLVFKDYPWASYIDPIGSLIIAGFLLFSIYAVVTHSVYDLLDKTLDEGIQLIIINQLVAFFDEYRKLHGVRSRRSGGDIYIEIFLEFDGDRAMRDVQAVINAMKEALEKNIGGSSVSIVPTTDRTGGQAGLCLLPVLEDNKR